jgi:serine/threonine-protein kinase HipA
MTSDARECFVYIALPGTTELVTAGRFEHGVDRHGVPLGRFVYGRRYRERSDAVAIDPLELRLASQVYETRRMKGVFGALRDAAPDYWGRRVIEKHAAKAGLEEMDYLLLSPDDRAGALGFGLSLNPPAPHRAFNRTLDLERLQALADAVIADEALPAGTDPADWRQVEELLLIGTAMGGARPKAVVEGDDALWIAKFNRADDRWNHARIEHAMLLLARECGIHTAHSRIVTMGDRDALLVKRFDRERTESGYRRARMLSALTLLRTGDTHQDRDRWSYVLLVEELRRLCADPKADAHELYRRMVFNALISNLDDHPRNHAVVAMSDEWKLSPAYDLTPAPVLSIESRSLSMSVGDLGRVANVANLMSQCERFLLTPSEAQRIIDETEATIRTRWYEIARREGVSEADCARIAGAFIYGGFRLKSELI